MPKNEQLSSKHLYLLALPTSLTASKQKLLIDQPSFKTFFLLQRHSLCPLLLLHELWVGETLLLLDLPQTSALTYACVDVLSSFSFFRPVLVNNLFNLLEYSDPSRHPYHYFLSSIP